jgi:hypothetical protein
MELQSPQLVFERYAPLVILQLLDGPVEFIYGMLFKIIPLVKRVLKLFLLIFQSALGCFSKPVCLPLVDGIDSVDQGIYRPLHRLVSGEHLGRVHGDIGLFIQPSATVTRYLIEWRKQDRSTALVVSTHRV